MNFHGITSIEKLNHYGNGAFRIGAWFAISSGRYDELYIEIPYVDGSFEWSKETGMLTSDMGVKPYKRIPTMFKDWVYKELSRDDVKEFLESDEDYHGFTF